jgi:hypothetical protein
VKLFPPPTDQSILVLIAPADPFQKLDGLFILQVRNLFETQERSPLFYLELGAVNWIGRDCFNQNISPIEVESASNFQ